jgi:acetyltransferase-like isoleucine patch superfamily enzyme
VTLRLQRARALRARAAAARLVWETDAALVPPPAWAYAHYGANTTVVPPARVEHPEAISIGSTTLIHEHVWLAARPRPDGRPSLVVGDTVLFQRFVKVVAAESVTIEDGVNIGDHAYIGDVEYVPTVGRSAPEHVASTTPRPVVLQHHALLGVGTTVLPGVTIGSYAYIGAGSVVADDIPPRSLAVGAPARVVNEF